VESYGYGVLGAWIDGGAGIGGVELVEKLLPSAVMLFFLRILFINLLM
jgi:hypothetical protein